MVFLHNDVNDIVDFLRSADLGHGTVTIYRHASDLYDDSPKYQEFTIDTQDLDEQIKDHTHVADQFIKIVGNAVEAQELNFNEYFQKYSGKYDSQTIYNRYSQSRKDYTKLFDSDGLNIKYIDAAPGTSLEGAQQFLNFLRQHQPELRDKVERAINVRVYEKEMKSPTLLPDSDYQLPDGSFAQWEYIKPEQEWQPKQVWETSKIPQYAADFGDYFFEDTTLDDAIYNCADDNTDISWYDLNQWMTDQDHIDTFEETLEEGLINTRDFDYHQAVQIAQTEHMRNTLTEHKEDLIKMAGWERAAELGIYALERNTAEEAGELLFDQVDLTDDQMTRDTLNSSIDANLTEMINEQLPEEQQIRPNELQEWIKQNPRNPLFVSLEGARMESTTLKNAAEKLGIKVGDPVEKKQTKAQAQVSVESSTNLTKEDMSIQASEDHSPDANAPDPTTEKVSESSPVVQPLGKEGIRNLITERTQQKIQHVETPAPLTQQQEQQHLNR
ncbi:hypothetical protein [Aeriscardovia aeriphila]|uniref:Uncharacterized protein n=1 Tax=Aeriscardovia aeriphila TaxID=218139 RepID=A0A261FBI6_9BIFI|nr:hypothetical protein [Aeriscardovia aeriphila]NYI25326.1 hypothetical protein [Aeriscardovia aeriphila]OZG56520.1 hypothetical protein AEAE_1008 [Aeriscardovia aeriphila]